MKATTLDKGHIGTKPLCGTADQMPAVKATRASKHRDLTGYDAQLSTQETSKTRIRLWHRIKEDPRVRSAVRKAVSAQMEHLVATVRLEERVAYSEPIIMALMGTIRKSTDADTIAVAEARLAGMQEHVGNIDREQCIRSAHATVDSLLKTVRNLCNVADRVLAELESQVQEKAEAPKKVHSELTPQETCISRDVESIRADIKSFRADVKGVQSDTRQNLIPARHLMEDVILFFHTY